MSVAFFLSFCYVTPGSNKYLNSKAGIWNEISSNARMKRKISYTDLKKNSMVWVRERTTPTERPPLVGEVIANFCGERVPCGQRDGSLRPYSRFSRQEPLLFYQVAPQLYSRGWMHPVTDPLLFFLVVPGIEPGPPDLYPRTLTTRPQRRSSDTDFNVHNIQMHIVRGLYCIPQQTHSASPRCNENWGQNSGLSGATLTRRRLCTCGLSHCVKHATTLLLGHLTLPNLFSSPPGKFFIL
jgi:hypothetical protein